MAIDLKDFHRLKSNVDRLQREADKAAGVYAEQMRRLKQEHGCSTIEEAEKLLAKITKEHKAAEKKFEKLAIEFEDRWGDVL